MILSSNRSHFDGSCAARTNTLASLRGSIARIETSGDVRGLNKVALGHTAADALLRGGLATSAVHEVFAEGHQGAAATGFVAGHRGAAFIAKAAGLGAAGFCRSGIRRAVDERPDRAWPRSALSGHRARRRCRVRAALNGGRARLRCARRRRAGSLWRPAPARSRRQPQAHARRASLRGHCAVAACRCRACRLHRRDALDRARGAFAASLALNACGALECLGRAAVRRRAPAQPSWPGRAVDHGMEM